MNAIKMKWDPAATGVNKDWISKDFAINYEDIHKNARHKAATALCQPLYSGWQFFPKWHCMGMFPSKW